MGTITSSYLTTRALATLTQRTSASLLIVTIGCLLIHMMQISLRARVESITLLPGSRTVKIKTLSMYGRGYLTFPVDDIRSSESCLNSLSPDFLKAVDDAIKRPVEIKVLANAMKREDQTQLISSGAFSGSIKLDVKGLKYKLDVDNSGVYHEPALFNKLFNK